MRCFSRSAKSSIAPQHAARPSISGRLFGDAGLRSKAKWSIRCLLALVLLGIGTPGSVVAYAEAPFLLVLGTAQDGGYPQAGCAKACCKPVWDDAQQRRFVSCLAVVDPDSGERFLLDCTPDFRDQLRLLDQLAPQPGKTTQQKVIRRQPIDGVLPTHAHVGHYAGLIHLGREVMGAEAVPVFAMPRMKYFLETNGPWSQLVELQQIDLRRIVAGEKFQLNARISATPFLVPHRDEFSETVGFQIDGPNRSALYLPDIDKWERWDVRIEDRLAAVDIAFLDGTFFNADELPGRDMQEIPHPFVQESVDRFAKLPDAERAKVHFIHLNHSNPLLRSAEKLLGSGMNVARQGQKAEL